MSDTTSDEQWYVVSTAELATTLAHADTRVRMARESLDAVHQDMSRTIVALGDVEIEVRKSASDEARPAFAVQESFEEVRRRGEQTARDAEQVRDHLGHTRAALEAGQVLLAGMPVPTTEQERVDQEAMHARLVRLHRTVGEAIPLAEQVRDRMGDTAVLAEQGRDLVVGRQGRAAVDELSQDVTRSRSVAHEIDHPIDVVEVDVRRAAGQAAAVASAARLRATQSVSGVTAGSPQPSGIRR